MDIWGWLDNSDSVLFSSRTEFLPIGSFFLSCFLEKYKGRIADTLKNCRHSQSISGRSTRCAVDIHPWRSPHESTLSQHQHATFQQPGLRADCFISPLSKTTCFYFIHILEEDCKAKNIIKRHEKPINEIVPLLSDVFKKINAECRQAGITNSRSFQIYDRDFHLHLGFPLSSFSFLSGQPFPINTDGIFTGPFNLLDFLEENERKLLLTNIFVDHARVSSNRKFRVFHKLRHPSRPHNPPIISQLQSIYIVTVNYILVMCELYSDGSAGNHMNGDTPRCQGTSVPYRFSPHDAPSAMRDATTSSNPHPVVYYGSSTASRRRSQSADEGPAIPYIRKPSALTSAASSQVSPPASSHHHRLQDTAQRGSFSESSDSGSSVKSQRVCSSCGRGDSPEWRRGPSGLRDLCNACGLRYARSISKNAHTQKRRREGSFGEDADVIKFAAGPAHGASISTFEDRGMHHFTQTECVRQPTPYLPRYNESLDPPYIAPTHTYPQYSKHLPAPIEPTIRPPAVSMLKDHTFSKRKGMPASLANILTTDPMPNSDSSETESPTRTKEEVPLN